MLKELTGGAWPLGWYTGRDSPNTRRLVADHGGYEYDSDYYGDDLPFWMPVTKSDGTLVPHLVVPYSLDTNDMRFVQAQGFNTGEHFFNYLRDAFDALYAEGDEAPEDDDHRHALPAARPARAHRLAAALSRPRAAARPGLGLPAHRHRAPLEGDASRSTPVDRPRHGSRDADADPGRNSTPRRAEQALARCSTAPTSIRRGSPRPRWRSARSQPGRS